MEPSTYLYERAISEKPDWRSECATLQQAAHRLAAVSCGPSKLVDQLGCGPRRLTPLVPLRQGLERLLFVQCESAR
jgi:hypothetical protein